MRQVLDQRASPPYVERLQAIANSQDWLALVECVMQKKIVCSLPRFVFRSTFLYRLLSIPGRINIRRAPGQQYRRAGGEHSRLLGPRLLKRDRNRHATRGFYRADVLGQATLVVSLVC